MVVAGGGATFTPFFADALAAADALDPGAALDAVAAEPFGPTGVMLGPAPFAAAVPVAPALPLGEPSAPDDGTAGGAPPVVGAVVAVGGPQGGMPPSVSSPSHFGFRQMITAIPHAVTRSNIAMNARSRCLVLGPRGRTTMVGVLPRRAFTGRSGMRIVICGAPRGCTGIGCGVCG